MSTTELAYALRFSATGQSSIAKGMAGIRKDAKTSAGYLESSFNNLDIRPFKGVEADIKRLQLSYKTLARSGKLSIGELAKAKSQLKIKTAALKAETNGWVTQMGQAKAGLLALAGGVYAAAKAFGSFSGFSQKMAEVNTLLDVSQTEFKGLSDEILGMTSRLPMAANDLASAEYDIISAGVALGDSTTVLEQAAKAAVAGVTDTKTAVNAGLSVINSYGQGVDKLDETYDILFQTVKLGVTTFPALANSIGSVLPIARGAGVEFKEVSASIATMTKAGIKTDVATTALRGALSALSSPANEAKKAMAALGITWNGLSGTIKQIADKNLGAEALRKMIPDVQARTAVLALSQNYGVLKNTLAEMNTAAGATGAAYDKMKDTPANQIKLFANEIDRLKIGLGATLSEGLLPVAKGLRVIIDGFRESGPVTQGLTNTLLVGVTGLTAWHLGLGKVWNALQLARAHMLTTTAAIPGLSLALKGGLAVAVAAVVYQLGQAVIGYIEFAAEMDKQNDILEQQMIADDKRFEQLQKIGQQLGITISSMDEYNGLVDAGAIARNQETAALELNYNAYLRYHAGFPPLIVASQDLAKASATVTLATLDQVTAQTAAEKELKNWIAGLQGAGEGVKSYELTLADLKIALAQGAITQAEYNTKTLAAEKLHWQEMVDTHKAAVKTMAEAGTTGTKEYEEALLKLRDAELKVIETEGKLAEAVDKTAKKWDTAAERLGLTEAQLLEVKYRLGELKRPAEEAGDGLIAVGDKGEEGGEKAAEGAEFAGDAWQAVADDIGYTVEELKAAIAEVGDDIDNAYTNLDGSKRTSLGPIDTSQQYAYAGAVDYTDQLNDAMNMSVAELDAAAKDWTALGNQNATADPGGFWADAERNWAKMGSLLNDLQAYMANPAIGMSQQLQDNLSPQDLAALQSQFEVNTEAVQNNTAALEQNLAALTPEIDLLQIEIPELSLPEINFPESQTPTTNWPQSEAPGEIINVNLCFNGASITGSFDRTPETETFLSALEAAEAASI